MQVSLGSVESAAKFFRFKGCFGIVYLLFFIKYIFENVSDFQGCIKILIERK